jgi:RNA polymerase sigma factor (sigma-70 family)
MQHISDNILIDRIRKEDNASFDELYRSCFPLIANYVRQNSGSHTDAEDIFQESIIVLLQKVRQPDFILTSALKTYLFAISKNLWLKRLRDNKLISIANDLEPYITDTNACDLEIEREISEIEKLKGWLDRITENCQRILKAIFFHQEPMESLIKKMGWKNNHTAANQKYKCIEQVKRQSKK